MRKRVSATLVAGASSALLLAGTGIASAAPATEGTPTTDNQVCGTVYTDAPWVENGPPPTGAQGVSDVTITLDLYDASGNLMATDTTATGSGGEYCATGDSTMAFEVAFNDAYVVMTADSPSTPSPWQTQSGDSHIDASIFQDHIYLTFPPLQSAWHFNFVQ